MKSNCTSCGAQIVNGAINCDYCGSLIVENVKTLDAEEINQVESVLEVLMNNIEGLRSFPKPTEIVRTVLWFYAVVFTMGIVIFFWKKPKSKFKLEELNKLKSIIQTNIDLLKVKYQNHKQIMAQVDILHKEFNTISEELNRQLQIRKKIIIGSICLFIIILIIGQVFQKKEPSNISKYLSENETYLFHDANLPQTLFAVVTETQDSTMHIAIVNTTVQKRYEVYNANDQLVAETKIGRIKFINDKRIEYIASHDGKDQNYIILWDESRKGYFKK